MSCISLLLGKVPIGVKHSFLPLAFLGNKLYSIPSESLSVIVSNGYNPEISGSSKSVSSIGMKIDTLAFGTPTPLLTITLPTTTP